MTEFEGPIGRIRLGYKVTQTLGWRWALTRLYLEAETRSGLLERRTPATTWDAYELTGNIRFDPQGAHPEAAGECLRAQPAEVEERLRRHADLLKERRFDVFGTRVLVHDWHHDPIDGASYPSNRHWSQVEELPGADLKLVWEPSRFGWAFDLARLHALDPSSSAPDVFWSLFEDWCSANQPFLGVNWRCGQEVAIRLMAVAFTVKAFRGAGLTDDRQILLAKFADVSARRIEAHWRYARSQENNHIVSEAVGLVGYGLLFPGIRGASKMLHLGEDLLRHACERLIFADGGTSQYSANYHRVFVDNLIWINWLYNTSGQQPSEPIVSALRRASAFMCAITNPRLGDLPSFGNDDGAHLLPLATDAHRDVRSTLMMAAKLTGSQWLEADAPAHEATRWLCGADVSPRDAPIRAQPQSTRVELFRHAEVAVLTNGGHRLIVRGGSGEFRATQNDMGHIETWFNGDKIVSDPGTYTYKPAAGDPDYAQSCWHNAPHRLEGDSLTRLTRFLWSDPPEAKIRVNVGDALWVGQFDFPSGFSFTRSIFPEANGWLVYDTCLTANAMCWLVNESTARSHRRASSRSYQREAPSTTAIHITSTGNTTTRFVVGPERVLSMECEAGGTLKRFGFDLT